MIPPFFLQILGMIVRLAVVWCAGYLTRRAGVTLTDDQIDKIVLAVVPVLAVAAWSFRSKLFGRQKLMTALATTGQLTEKEAEQMVKNPLVPTPSVLGPKDEVPS